MKETRASEGARRILLNTSYRSIADLGGKVASFALYVVMARKLGSSEFGVYTFSFAFVAIVTILGDFGQDSVLIREVAGDHRRVSVYFTNTLAIKLILAVSAFVLAITLLTPFTSTKTLEVTALLGVGVILELLAKTCFAVGQAYEQLSIIPSVLVPQRLFASLLGIAALLLGADVVVVAAIYLLAAALALVLALWLLFTKVVQTRLEIAPAIWRSLMIAAIPIGIANVANLVLFRVDMVMLAAFKPPSIVGEYGAAYRLVDATLFLSWSVGAAVFPVFSRLTPNTEPTVGFVFERSLKLLVALTLPLAVGAFVLADPIVHLLYGHQYESAVTALRLLAPTIALYPICYAASDCLISQRRQRVLTITYIAVAAENILLNLILIPTFSLNGAALGTSVSQLLVAVPVAFFSRRAVAGMDWRRIVTGPLLASAVAAATMAALAGNLTLAVTAGVALYMTALIIFEKIAFPEDARVMIDLARRAG